MHFYVTGRVASYLHPAFHSLTMMSGIVLLLLAFGVLFLPAEEDACCDAGCATSHGEQRPILGVISALVLVVPLLVAATVSPDQFGEAIVTNRGYIEKINDLPGYKPAIEPPCRPPIHKVMRGLMKPERVTCQETKQARSRRRLWT